MRARSRGRLGTVDADDLMALFDAVAARPDIDASRAGVLGGSYGGFMTAWLAAHHGAALPRRDLRARRLRLGQPATAPATSATP